VHACVAQAPAGKVKSIDTIEQMDGSFVVYL
jgi:hypothetical protein